MRIKYQLEQHIHTMTKPLRFKAINLFKIMNELWEVTERDSDPQVPTPNIA